MANQAVKLGTIAYPFANKASGPLRAHLIAIVYDTIDEDLEIYQPAANKHCGIACCDLITENDATFYFKTGSMTLSTPPVSSTGGYSKSLDDSIMLPCLVGDAFIFKSSSTLASAVFYMVEF